MQADEMVGHLGIVGNIAVEKLAGENAGQGLPPAEELGGPVEMLTQLQEPIVGHAYPISLRSCSII